MNDGLIDAFRHNAWASRQLLLVCQELDESQLDATVPGTYGSIIETLRHIAYSEAGYCARLTGEPIPWNQRTDPPPGIDELTGYFADLDGRWERFLAEPFDAERTFVFRWIDGYDRDVPAGIVLAQAIHHGSEHRSQVATILTTIGVEPPGWGLWEFAEDTNRAPRREA